MDGLNGYASLVFTYLLFGLMGSVSGLRLPAVIGMVVFTVMLAANYMLLPPSENGVKAKAEDLCGCRLRA